jgi:hypothetical protein
MFWIVTVTERRSITRIVVGCETPARDLHLRLLPLVGKQYLAVSLCTAVEEPMRSDNEKQRAAELMRRVMS